MEPQRFTYTDHTRQASEQPRVDVLMIQVREDDHAWVKQANKSVDEQTYPELGMWVTDNRDRSVSIGQAWNDMVRQSDAELVQLLGDDDALAPSYIRTMVDEWQFVRERAPNAVHITSYCTVLDDRTNRMASMLVPHTGMFLRQFLLDHPFDETLTRHVGAEMFNRIGKVQASLGQPMTTSVAHFFGYIFRQHTFMNSGNPIAVGGQR